MCSRRHSHGIRTARQCRAALHSGVLSLGGLPPYSLAAAAKPKARSAPPLSVLSRRNPTWAAVSGYAVRVCMRHAQMGVVACVCSVARRMELCAVLDRHGIAARLRCSSACRMRASPNRQSSSRTSIAPLTSHLSAPIRPRPAPAHAPAHAHAPAPAHAHAPPPPTPTPRPRPPPPPTQ
jgi:hypothetical protein